MELCKWNGKEQERREEPGREWVGGEGRKKEGKGTGKVPLVQS